MSSYDLAVAYRIYPKVSKPSLGLPFSDDKLRLSEICLRSFKESLRGLRVKIWAILDGCPESFADLFRKYFDPDDLVLVPLPAVGNHASFGKQIDIRRPDLCVAVAPKHPGANVLRDDQEDIRRRGLRLLFLRGKSGEGGATQKEFTSCRNARRKQKQKLHEHSYRQRKLEHCQGQVETKTCTTCRR